MQAVAAGDAAPKGRSPRVVEVLVIADVLWFLPTQARRPVAAKLHGLGVRLRPEMAAPDAAELASDTQRHAVALSREKGLAFMRGAAAQIGSADLADLADRVEAADTPEKIAAEGERLNAATISESIKVVAEHLENAGDLENAEAESDSP